MTETEITIKKPSSIKTRWNGIDILRGLGIMLMFLIHASVYHYGKINELDFDNLPPLLMIINVFNIGGGFFAIISGAVNVYAVHHTILKKNSQEDDNYKIFPDLSYFFKYAVLILVFHFIYNFFLGPTSHNFETYVHKYALIPGWIREGFGYYVSIERILEGSALSMVALNLIGLGFLCWILFRKGGVNKLKRNKWVFMVIGIVIELMSFVRIYLHNGYDILLTDEKYFLAFLVGFLAAKPFPFIPYFGYACIGAYFGLLLTDSPSKKTIRRQAWWGVLWWVVAVGAFLIPNAFYSQFGLLEDIFLSYIVVQFNLGLHIFELLLAIRVVDYGKMKRHFSNDAPRPKYLQMVGWFGKNSFLLFLIEPLIREPIGKLLTVLLPGWNNTIGFTLLFGVGIMLLWIGISLIMLTIKKSSSNARIKQIVRAKRKD